MSACTLCGSEATRRLADDCVEVRLCEVCYGALAQPGTDAGRALRRVARSISRRVAAGVVIDPLSTERRLVQCRAASARRRADPKNAEQRAAQNAVAYAILAGSLVRPDACQRCGTPATQLKGRSELWFLHTHGYARSFHLVGEWLCRGCHVIATRFGGGAEAVRAS